MRLMVSSLMASPAIDRQATSALVIRSADRLTLRVSACRPAGKGSARPADLQENVMIR